MSVSIQQAALNIRETNSAKKLRVVPFEKKPVFNKIAISTLDAIVFLSFNDILFCESQSNYTTVITRDGKRLTCCKTLKDIESKLPEDLFFRLHASYLVSIQDITALKKHGDWEIEIDHKHLLPVSRSKKEELGNLLNC